MWALTRRIARALVEAGTMNPVFLLDEMDKVGADWRGDPSSALLEVLDPAQNHTFRRSLPRGRPGPLRCPLHRRRQCARDDSCAAARSDRSDPDRRIHRRGEGRDSPRHLLGRQIDSSGLRAEEIEVTGGALDALIDGYTREAGVRGLERVLGKLVRKVATKVAAGHDIPVVVGSR